MQEKTFRPSRWQLLPPVLSGSALKILAIVTMLIDHIGAVILPEKRPPPGRSPAD